MSGPLSRSEWEKVRRDSLSNLEKVAGAEDLLLQYQAKTVDLLDTVGVPVLVIEKSRRIGLTWGLAAYAVLRAGRARNEGGMDVMYISYSQEMTREFIDACAMWARAFALISTDTQEYLFEESDPDGDRSIKSFRIGFASGFEILALSSAPRSLRGKQGVVIIDEAAFVDNLGELLKAALAFLMWGGQVVVCSTHDGTDNPFNQMVQDILADRSSYAHMRIDFDDALKQGLYQRICIVSGREWSIEAEAEWREQIIDFYGTGADEELFCIPTQGSGAWLSGPLIEARMTVDAPVLRLELPGDYLQRPKLEQLNLLLPFMRELEETLDQIDQALRFSFGFDFGRVADLSIGSLLGIDDKLNRKETLSFELRNVPGDEQKQIVKAVLDAVRGRLIGAAFDATGMGWTVAEDMGRVFGLRDKDEGGGLIWAIKFSQDWYRVNMPPLKAAFEDDTIAIGRDADHMSDLRLVKMIRGIPMLPQTREGEKGKKRHGDYAIALALAHFASRMSWAEYDYEPVAPKRSRFDERSMDDDRGDGAFRLSSMRRRVGIF